MNLKCLPSDVIKLIKYYVLESPHKKELLKKVLNNYTYKITYNKKLTCEVLTCYSIKSEYEMYNIVSWYIVYHNYLRRGL